MKKKKKNTFLILPMMLSVVCLACGRHDSDVQNPETSTAAPVMESTSQSPDLVETEAATEAGTESVTESLVENITEKSTDAHIDMTPATDAVNENSAS